MDSRMPREFTLEVSADRSTAKDVIAALLHSIFFHRVFTAVYPSTHEVLDITLPYVPEDDIESFIEQKSTAFVRQLETSSLQTSPQHGKRGKGSLSLQFLEKKRKKSGWFVAKADEETVWEIWHIDLNVMSPRSEPEAARNRVLMEKSLEQAAFSVLNIVNEERGHIPPITTNEPNPFPWQILFNAKG